MEMSKRKDRERAEAGHPFRQNEEEPEWKCFLCESLISKEEGSKLTSHVTRKSKEIIGIELDKIQSLGGSSRDRICTKCYKEKVESGT